MDGCGYWTQLGARIAAQDKHEVEKRLQRWRALPEGVANRERNWREGGRKGAGCRSPVEEGDEVDSEVRRLQVIIINCTLTALPLRFHLSVGVID